MNEVLQTRNDRQVAHWLLICAGVIFLMIILGGVTRLTHSGLSMVEWKPLVGIVPPLNEEQWQETFNKYKQFPEYKKINHRMDLDEFKAIFLFEYAHRVLGRLIGVIFLFPFLYFYFKKRLRPKLTPKLMIMFALGGMQGLLGWYMVKSGLVDNPYVSQYRLTAHLGAAVLIYAYILWVAFGLLFSSHARLLPVISSRSRHVAKIITGLLFFMILSGGLVAGTRAGFAYPTFPLMGDRFIPEGVYSMSPGWLSIFEDLTTIQFNHRIFAYTMFFLIVGFGINLLRRGAKGILRLASHTMLGLLLVQITLGVLTLLMFVPVPVAAAHQGCAILLFTAVLLVTHALHNQTQQIEPQKVTS